MVSAILWWAVILCGVSAIASAWAIGAGGHCGPTDKAVRAKRWLLLSLAAALLIGVAIPLVNASYGIA
jgi:hypothetical protein